MNGLKWKTISFRSFSFLTDTHCRSFRFTACHRLKPKIVQSYQTLMSLVMQGIRQHSFVTDSQSVIVGLIGWWVLLDAEVYQSEEGPDSKVWRCRWTICWWRLCFRSSGHLVRCLLPSRLLCLLLNAAFYLLLKQTMKHDSSPIYLFLGESLLVGKESYIFKKTNKTRHWYKKKKLQYFIYPFTFHISFHQWMYEAKMKISRSNVTSVKLGHVATRRRPRIRSRS